MNKNYSNILKAGFDIEIRSQRFAKGRMYLTLNGARTGQWTEFTSGHYNASVTREKAKITRRNTHLDKAFRYLANSMKVLAALNSIAERDTLLAAMETPTAETRQLIKI